jgi:putative hydrolase of the HAD superfamily
MHPALQSVRAVFFDAVGTLLLPAEPVSATYRRIAARHGLNLDENTVRTRLVAAFERQELIDHQASWRTSEERERKRWETIVCETLREADDPLACFEDLWSWFSRPGAWMANPDTGEVLAILHQRGLILGMASNFDARLNGLISRIEAFALLEARCVVSSLATWRKPSRAFFAEVARVAGHEPGEILFIGDDRRNDLEGALAAGFRGLLLDKNGEKSAERIHRLGELVEENR